MNSLPWKGATFFIGHLGLCYKLVSRDSITIKCRLCCEGHTHKTVAGECLFSTVSIGGVLKCWALLLTPKVFYSCSSKHFCLSVLSCSHTSSKVSIPLLWSQNSFSVPEFCEGITDHNESSLNWWIEDRSLARLITSIRYSFSSRFLSFL